MRMNLNRTHGRVHAHTHGRTHGRTRKHTRTHTHTHARTHAYMQSQTYTHACIHARTHTHYFFLHLTSPLRVLKVLLWRGSFQSIFPKWRTPAFRPSFPFCRHRRVFTRWWWHLPVKQILCQPIARFQVCLSSWSKVPQQCNNKVPTLCKQWFSWRRNIPNDVKQRVRRGGNISRHRR